MRLKLFDGPSINLVQNSNIKWMTMTYYFDDTFQNNTLLLHSVD